MKETPANSTHRTVSSFPDSDVAGIEKPFALNPSRWDLFFYTPSNVSFVTPSLGTHPIKIRREKQPA
ncbi:MAG: hypothetical protein ACRC4N_05895 [Gammaproteobacteria bacterium]